MKINKRSIVILIIAAFIIIFEFYSHNFSYKNLSDTLEIKVNSSATISIAKIESFLDIKYIKISNNEFKDELLELIDELKIKSSFINIDNIKFEGSKFYSLKLTANNETVIIDFFSDNYILISSEKVLYKALSEVNTLQEVDRLYEKYIDK